MNGKWPLQVLLGCLGSTLLCTISACSSVPSQRELHLIGRPEIVFLQRPANLGVSDDPSGFAPDSYVCLETGVLGAFICGLVQDFQHKEEIVAQNFVSSHSDEVKSLGFNDQTYAMFSSIMKGTSWLKDKDVGRVTWTEDETKYTVGSKADSVIFIQPTFALSRDGTELYVYAVAGIQKFAPDYPRDVYDIRRREFRFVHKLSLTTSDMNWNEVKAAGHRVRAMAETQTMQAWFDDDSARLREAFAQDLPKIEAGLRDLFGS